MNESIEAITRFIFFETPVSQADIILVPGGRARQQMERAAKLYHDGLAPYVLPSGGSNALLPDGLTEWEYLWHIGLELGIPENAFLKEDRSRNTFENAELSWRAVVEAGLAVEKAIIVCKAFHARRAYLTYRVCFPSHIQFMVSPIHDERDIRRDNWYRSPVGITKVMSEVEKIGRYFGHHIADWEGVMGCGESGG